MNDLKTRFSELMNSGTAGFRISFAKSFGVAVIIIVCLQLLGSLINIPGTIWPTANNFLIPLSFFIGGCSAIIVLIPYLNASWNAIKEHLLNPTSPALILLSIIFYLFLMPFAELMGSIVPVDGNQFLKELYRTLIETFEMMMNYKIAGFITICVLAPVFEEILFRGILLRGLLQNGISPVVAIALSSILFGAAHMNPWQFLGAGLLGAVFGFVYYRTRALWLCVFLHALNNTVSFVYMLKENSMEGSLTDTHNYRNITVFFILAIGCGWLIYKLTQSKPKWS